MDKLYTGIICLTKIDPERIIHSEVTGQDWARVSLIILETPDKFDNEVIIQNRGGRGKDHIIIGNANRRNDISFKFPKGKKLPSKIDTRCDKCETYRDYEP